MIKEKKVRTKKINAKDKGNTFERRISNLLKEHWNVTAYRTPGSGAYTSRNVSKAFKEAAVGDVVIEELPEVVIECKNYYSLHFTNWFKKKPKEESLWGFWTKLSKEAEQFKKTPLLICKEDCSPMVCIMSFNFFSRLTSNVGKFNSYFTMVRDGIVLVAVEFEELLSLDLETVKVIINSI